MSVVKADRFTALKAKVKTEMQRRNQSGSVAGYGGSGYDYTVAPAAGGVIRAEHRDKLVEPMRAVNSDLVPAASGSVIREDELANLETRVNVWAARSMTDQSGSDCKSGCTGTCYTGCATGCSGCSGCSGCGSGCATGCSGCGSGCPTGCSSCGSGCASGCSGCSGCDGCTGTCEGDCEGCTGTCSGTCTGCGSDCTGGCKGTCSTQCAKKCSSGCAVSCISANTCNALIN